MELRPGLAGALIDSPDGVLVTGAPPGGTVAIEATLELGGHTWSCAGVYVADRDGEVDTAEDPSSGGSYRGVDPFGLFWSDSSGMYDWDVLHPMRVSLRATCDDLVAQSAYSRAVVGHDVTEHVIAEQDAKGRLFLPGQGRGRGVVLLAGSDGGPGGVLEAALFAGHGLPALALAHWNHPGTPDAMRDIDVEVVVRGCDWLRTQQAVDDVPPCLIGISRGGELALLAAALAPDHVGPVVSQVGSGVPWGAFGPGADDNDPAWIFQGKPVPKMYEHPDDSYADLDSPDSVAAAEIAIEKAAGPVLLLSGEDDAMWPSARLSRIAEARAAREGAADRVTHVAYQDAGHWCTIPPGFPLAAEVVHPVADVRVEIGGSRTGNQAARLDSWRRILDLVGATR